MSKYCYLIDAGHGGVINGVYQTPGKRSPAPVNGKMFYEGEHNRLLASKLFSAFKNNGIDFYDVVSSDNDIALNVRVNRANMIAKKKPCVYISLHSDAAGNGKDWHSASGISVYTSKGKTESDVFADYVISELQKIFKETVKWRTDFTDKDKDKEENLYVLRETICLSILLELGFHTNLLEVQRMVTDEWKDKIVESLVNAIFEFEKHN